MLLDLGQITHADQRDGPACIVRVHASRTIKERTSSKSRYFISSVPQSRAGNTAKAARSHWGIDHPLHQRLDVVFGEDACRVRERGAE